MEYVHPFLPIDVLLSPLRDMRWCLVHDDNQVTTFVMVQHLPEKLNDFLGADPFVMKTEQELPPTGDRRHCRDPASLSSNALFRGLPARSPGLSQQGG